MIDNINIKSEHYEKLINIIDAHVVYSTVCAESEHHNN